MLPALLSTVRTPSATFHRAGDLSFTVTHWSRLVPSKRTIASAGGAPTAGAGVTTGGTGSHTSVSLGLPRGAGAVAGAAAGAPAGGGVGFCCAAAGALNKISITRDRNLLCIRMSPRLGYGRTRPGV